MATAIFYASSTGNTSGVAKDIAKILGSVETFDIASTGVEKIKEYDKIILGSSTWGEGDLQDDWEELWDDFSEIDFSGKIVALFGLGDQDGYPDNYVDAMGLIYEKVIENGAKVVGLWDVTDEYFHDESHAIKDGSFVGLALDDDNQNELTQERVTAWCEQIRSEIL
ncbi:MAG: flavodoxin [Arcobacteraceae bacterium]|nr:flavodoxin [Arcobacteraceae bacterium]